MDKEKPNYYAVIPADIRYDKRLKPNEKLLYGEITCLTQSSGECFATNKYFAKLYGVTTQCVSGWINKLNKLGYINIRIIHAENSKQIISRYIKINEYPINKKFNTPTKINEYPINKKFNTPINKKFKDNNTSINNTSINKNNSSFLTKTRDGSFLKKTEDTNIIDKEVIVNLKNTNEHEGKEVIVNLKNTNDQNENIDSKF